MILKAYFEVYPWMKPDSVFFCSCPLATEIKAGNRRYVATIEIPDHDGDHVPVTSVSVQEVKP